MELYKEGDDFCHDYIEYLNTENSSNGLPKQITITESELRQKVFGNEKEKKKKIRVVIFSGALGSYTVEDVGLLKSKKSLVKLPKSQTGDKSGLTNCRFLLLLEPGEVRSAPLFVRLDDVLKPGLRRLLEASDWPPALLKVANEALLRLFQDD